MTVLWVILGALTVTVTASCLSYYNKAFPEALDIAAQMEKIGNDYYFHGDSNVGFIIFSGAKADEKAYTYIAKLLHDAGHTVVVPKVPVHLSMLGTRHGREIMDANPHIDKWILVGHSLGGWPATHIVAEQSGRVLGIALLATMATADLSGLDVSAIRITAENDKVMNKKMMDSYCGNLPRNTLDIELKGANHTQFGAYKSFGRDGVATMTWQEQQEKTVRLILDFFDAQITDVAAGEQ